MNIYLRKVFKHDITHQISVTKEVLTSFFCVSQEGEKVLVSGKNSKYVGIISFLLSTDPRFGQDIKKIISEEGGMEENDLLLFVKDEESYTLEVIKENDSRHSIFNSVMEKDRHLIVHMEDAGELYKSDFSRNRIIFGAPGTGKSYMLNKDKDKLISNGGGYERVTFHPDYSYAHFVGTYKPIPSKNVLGEDIIKYEYVPGPFMRAYVRALKNKPLPFLLLIEEINRANMAAVFGDTFQLLDRKNNVSEYPIQTSQDIRNYLAKSDNLGGAPEDYTEIQIPDNMFIWATMNSADQGVFPMDTAFKRRWNFTYIGINDNDYDFAGKDVVLGTNKYKRKIEWNSLRKAINDRLAFYKINEDKQLGPHFLSQESIMLGNEIDASLFSEVFKSKVIMYLFNDAAKQKVKSLFGGCEENKRNRYSSICEEFDEKGIFIFEMEISNQIPAEPTILMESE